MEKEDEQESGRGQPEGERKFSQEQYDMLKRCSDKKDMTEWNQWRKKHPEEKIRLKEAHLENADLGEAHLENANLGEAHLENADLYIAHLENADLSCTHLENANLMEAHLENAFLGETHLENADLAFAHLEGAEFYYTSLEGASFVNAIVDGHTLFVECELDSKTDFRRVGLDSARIGPATKQLLEYNARRTNWEEWYKKNPKMKWLVKPFWLMSDYGLSTGRIIITFFGLALIFANIYYHWAQIAPPGIVSNLLVDNSGAAVPWWLVPLRTLYFSIVTMTTLGFGDMYAKGQSIFGHLFLMVQVILGYVLLGALVTRFAVLFTAGGPAGTFSQSKIKETGEGEKNKA